MYLHKPGDGCGSILSISLVGMSKRAPVKIPSLITTMKFTLVDVPNEGPVVLRSAVVPSTGILELKDEEFTSSYSAEIITDDPIPKVECQECRSQLPYRFEARVVESSGSFDFLLSLKNALRRKLHKSAFQ